MGILALYGHREILANSSLKAAKKKKAGVISKIQVSDLGPLVSELYPFFRLTLFILPSAERWHPHAVLLLVFTAVLKLLLTNLSRIRSAFIWGNTSHALPNDKKAFADYKLNDTGLMECVFLGWEMGKKSPSSGGKWGKKADYEHSVLFP